jgi:hypothetical protein
MITIELACELARMNLFKNFIKLEDVYITGILRNQADNWSSESAVPSIIDLNDFYLQYTMYHFYNENETVNLKKFLFLMNLNSPSEFEMI